MSIKPETISQLETMIKADPALVAQLQSCTDSASSAAVIAKAAAAKGMDVTEPDLVAYFEAAVANNGAMSDAELEQVAGGVRAEVIVLTIIGPLFCAAISIIMALNPRVPKGNCM